ncbi:hypothetical protein ACIQVK_53475 [Streptomyces sp. NPDC090493]|uniref:hypothetical protein n=1 Tax=Streptomyces sp. NPDC090493 TaxID=3365964 RepID=UPI0038250451
MKDHQGRGRGMPRGTRYAAPTYDPATGKPYRPGTHFDPQTAEKLIKMCERLNLSVSGFLTELVAAVQVDPDGRPVGWPEAVTLREVPKLKEAG